VEFALQLGLALTVGGLVVFGFNFAHFFAAFVPLLNSDASVFRGVLGHMLLSYLTLYYSE